MPRDPGEPREARLPNGLVVALRRLDAGAPSIAPWRDLAGRALVENVFYEPDYVLAAGSAFGPAPLLLMVADRPPDAPGSRLLALWPFRIVRRWGLPLPVLMGWSHGFSIFGAPLIDRERASDALAALVSAPDALGLPRRLLMPHLPLEGPLAGCLADTLARSGCRRAEFWTHRRAFLDLGARDAQARRGYLAERLSDRKSRQLARLARRMEAVGPVVYETLRDPADLMPAFSDYATLEQAGWKGRAGTAIGCRPAEFAFLQRVVEAYGAAGRARIDRLRRDGANLAASIGLSTATTFWYLKISHAEAEARNSPGAQLVARVTRTLLDEPGLAAADSCAPPDLPMIDMFWSERRSLAHGLIEAGGGDTLFPLAVRLERLRAAATGRPRALLAGLRNRLVRA